MLKLMKRQLRKKDLENEKIRKQQAAYQRAEAEIINDGFSDTDFTLVNNNGDLEEIKPPEKVIDVVVISDDEDE